MAKKRKYGSGTVRKRSDGRWEARVVVGYDDNGNPKTKNVLAKTKAECLVKLEELKEKYNLSYEEISYMGDDLPDICCLEKVGLACCPQDAVDEVKEVAHFVSQKDGGRGAVRELCDLILEAQGIKKDYQVCEGRSNNVRN